jgi:hypothetical protein
MIKLKKDTMIHPTTIVAGPPVFRPYPKRIAMPVAVPKEAVRYQ